MTFVNLLYLLMCLTTFIAFSAVLAYYSSNASAPSDVGVASQDDKPVTTH
jgi:hypothetical protein